MTINFDAYRPVVAGTRHAVAAGHYLAAEAGFEILNHGGNAIDARVAAGIALGVVHSDIVGVAGVAPTIIWLADRQEMVCIDGLGTWPKAVTPDFFQKFHGGRIPETLLRTVIPAAPAAWLTALERFGTMSFGAVAAAAIRFARDGFAMYPLFAESIASSEAKLRRWPDNEAIYLPNGRPPLPGERFVQADLAKTLQYMADQEAAKAGEGREAGIRAAYDAFYRGDIARTIADYHRENGGLMTMADLDEYRVRFEPTVRAEFAGIDVHCCGPWSQGPALAQTLNLLRGIDLKSMGHNSADYIHHIAEALKLAFADREAYYGDPAFIDVPLTELLSDAYTDLRRELIRDGVAWPEMPRAGDPRALLAQIAKKNSFVPSPAEPHAVPADTSYCCAMDSMGNAFSATPSDTSRQSPVIPGTGLVPSSRGSQSWADPSHPSSVAPGKRPRLTPNPALAMRDGKPFMAFGTPGGDVQTQAMVQTFLNVVTFGMDIQNAIEAPRFASYSYPSSFEPHDYFPGRLDLEARIPEGTADTLASYGHNIAWWPEKTWKAGGMCCIVNDTASGMLQAGADPRRAGYGLAW
ncbi:MAG: gamma-glutamyltransferase family protein [Proteobacteria bacterium]|nr:gamma-glutamyltransferase family protein [Pseudomonadota bacterium]